jgi:hypothetical protein
MEMNDSELLSEQVSYYQQFPKGTPRPEWVSRRLAELVQASQSYMSRKSSERQSKRIPMPVEPKDHQLEVAADACGMNLDDIKRVGKRRETEWAQTMDDHEVFQLMRAQRGVNESFLRLVERTDRHSGGDLAELAQEDPRWE